MAWDDVSKSGDNDAEFFITFSSAGFPNINLYFDIRPEKMMQAYYHMT